MKVGPVLLEILQQLGLQKLAPDGLFSMSKGGSDGKIVVKLKVLRVKL